MFWTFAFLLNRFDTLECGVSIPVFSKPGRDGKNIKSLFYTALMVEGVW